MARRWLYRLGAGFLVVVALSAWRPVLGQLWTVGMFLITLGRVRSAYQEVTHSPPGRA